MFFFLPRLLKCQEETASLEDGKWRESDEISHHCFLYMLQNLDGNEAEFLFIFLLHGHDNRLHNAARAKKTTGRPTCFLQKAFKKKRRKKKVCSSTWVYTGTCLCYMKAVGLNHTKAKPITGPEGWAIQCLVPLF